MILTTEKLNTVAQIISFKPRILTVEMKDNIEVMVETGEFSLDAIVAELQKVDGRVKKSHIKGFLKRLLTRLSQELTVTVRKKTFYVPKVRGQEDNLTLIDFLVLRIYDTNNIKEREILFEKVLKLAKPYVEYTASRYTKREQDRQDLISILSQDLWRLVNKWSPDKKYAYSNFHYLMLRQLRNQAFNELQRFKKANTPMRESDLSDNLHDVIDVAANKTMKTRDALETLETKDLINKLLKNVKDVKTHELLDLSLQDFTLDEIKQMTGRKSGLAIKRRQESVRPIVIDLLYGSCRQFIQDLLIQIDDDNKAKQIMAYYCAGKTVQEIKALVKLPVEKVRNTVEKYRKDVYNMLVER